MFADVSDLNFALSELFLCVKGFEGTVIRIKDIIASWDDRQTLILKNCVKSTFPGIA
jgi:hypothetical protein